MAVAGVGSTAPDPDARSEISTAAMAATTNRPAMPQGSQRGEPAPCRPLPGREGDGDLLTRASLSTGAFRVLALYNIQSNACSMPQVAGVVKSIDITLHKTLKVLETFRVYGIIAFTHLTEGRLA